jgi:hypothetical protein
VSALRERFPAESPQLADALAEVAQALQQAKAYPQAENLFQEILAIREISAAGAHDSLLAQAREHLAQLYSAWNKPEESAKWRKQRQPSCE